ncbi:MULTISPECIES: TAXI family TRAP transporter solute-binding subunit [Ramlibacter]|uniref:C4-dicarboxylate ABC transporter substrate-binding protein n=1 Tax=Ramlibacter pinisoli TaxID=2682844 RepID=A0A6N8IY40_9BURK|nr:MULTISPECIES: TAXI family TRAP transporter solute-binding subunit [Ramlibacter]MBA2961619.1 ABC transporter substrate-binding protein [Ramlibacter sp. CGMCC 1.13660]MVQ31562.1 C4-dicarboxylate ABC transporter substrate-binding protein [Ramlibacter pinisoli]
MTKAIRYTVVSVRDLLISAGPVAALAIGLLVLAYLWLDPAPPRTVRLATGPAQSAYDEFGKRYKAELARNGIEVVLVPSGGSTANERLLRDGKADLAFVQGGTSGGDTNRPLVEGLQSLGSLFLEPVWLFYREDAAKKKVPDGTLTALPQLEGLRLNAGSRGSGVPRMMRRLFEANRIDPASMTLSQLEQTPAVTAFLDGSIDALVFASAPESLMVQMLLQTPGVKLMDFAQADAYSSRFGFLTPVVLPRGIVDLSQDLPAQPVRLVATTTALLTREETHPALVQLFAQAARTIHSPAGWFNRARAFPSIEQSEYPISREAERAIQGGMPFLQRYLPFWLANTVERMWLALGIIIAVLLPLSRIVPPLYAFRIRSRVFRWYAQLRAIEERGAEEPGSTPELVRELDALEHRVAQVTVPLSYADELYALRSNINLVRSRLSTARATA